jgi:hypothetical protein
MAALEFDHRDIPPALLTAIIPQANPAHKICDSTAQPFDPATGRSISPIVAVALCIKPLDLLTFQLPKGG